MKISILYFFCTFLLMTSSIGSFAAANNTAAGEGGCDATYSYVQVDGGYTINFQPSMEFANTTYTWDFGNGNIINEVNPQGVDFENPGSYTVCLNISNGVCNETSCQTVDVFCTEGQTLEVAVTGVYFGSAEPEALTLSITGVDEYFEHELYYGPMSSTILTVYACNTSDCFQLAISDTDNNLLGTSYHVTVTIFGDQNVIYDQVISSPVLDANGALLIVNLPEDCTLENVSALTNQQVTAYPNPFSETLYINGIQSPFTANLYDMCGSLVRSSLVNASSSSISTSELSGGIYVLKVTTPAGVSSIRVMKE